MRILEIIEKIPEIRMRIRYGMDRDSGGDTPLHIAASMGHVRAGIGLLEAGADPNARNDQGLTPLDLCRSCQLANAMLEHGAEMEWGMAPIEILLVPDLDDDSQGAMVFACTVENPKLEDLAFYDKCTDDPCLDRVTRLIKNKDMDTLKKLEDTGLGLCEVDQSLLHLRGVHLTDIARNADVSGEMMDFLAGFVSRDPLACLPEPGAQRKASTCFSLAQHLLNVGADVNWEGINLLRELGILRPDMRDCKFDRNLLYHVSNIDVARFLVEDLGVRADHVDKLGNTPLFYSENTDVAQYLIEKGVAPEHKNRLGLTARDYQSGKPVLVLTGTREPDKAAAPLHYAVFEGKTEDIRTLIANGADVNARI